MTAQPSQPVGETTEALVERMRARANESEKGVDFVEGDDAELADDMLQDVALFRAAADGLARLAEVEAQRAGESIRAKFLADVVAEAEATEGTLKRRVAALEAEREKLVTLVRVGFLVTVNGERATADTVVNPEVRDVLFAILQAKDTAAALASLAAQGSGGPGAWLIHYEDADRDVEVFTGEGAETAARSRYDESRQSWNCTLFAAQGSTQDARFECGCWFSEVGCQRHPPLTGTMCCPIHLKPYGENPERRPMPDSGGDAERCPVCEGIDQPGLIHNPAAPYCSQAPAPSSLAEREAETADWRCECGDLNRWHELFCYRCGAGPPDEDDAQDPGGPEAVCVSCGREWSRGDHGDGGHIFELPAPSSLAEREEKR